MSAPTPADIVIAQLRLRIAEIKRDKAELLEALRMCQPYLPTPTATADEVAEIIKKYEA